MLIPTHQSGKTPGMTNQSLWMTFLDNSTQLINLLSSKHGSLMPLDQTAMSLLLRTDKALVVQPTAQATPQSSSRELSLGFLAMLIRKYNNNAQLANSIKLEMIALETILDQVQFSYHQSLLTTTLPQTNAKSLVKV